MRFLDPRPAGEAVRRPIANSVNIPLEELEGRMHELPSRRETIEVVGEAGIPEAAVAWLLEHGRLAEPVKEFEYGEAVPGRLWEPNPFLLEVIEVLPAGSALDLGCGSGREAVALAACGWHVTAVDHLPDALDLGRQLERQALSADHPRIEWLQMDLEAQLPAFERRFELVTSFFYLNRPVIERIAEYLAPGGTVVLETFTTVHRERFGKPRREHLSLRPGELLEIAGVETLLLDEDWHGDRHTARWWARRLGSV
jgi:tellurite methyltransferase